MNKRRLLTWFLASLPIALIGITAINLYIPNSEGFHAAESALRELPGVRARVGNVQQVKVLPFRLFRERLVGSDRYVLLSLRVIGDRDELDVRIRMIRKNDQWKVDYWTVTSGY